MAIFFIDKYLDLRVLVYCAHSVVSGQPTLSSVKTSCEVEKSFTSATAYDTTITRQ